MFDRTAMLLGSDGVALLAQKHVAVFGLGGVGGHLCEALARAGVGALSLFDHDTVAESNLNRQLVADRTTLGRNKAEIMVERAHRVNPACDARALAVYYRPGDEDFIKNLHADFIIDAIDDVPAKVSIAEICYKLKIPEISSMGTGNRLRPEMLQIADINKTSVCHLARKMRKELKDRRVRHLTVVYSKELPHKPIGEGHAPGSTSFVPPVSGMMMAGFVIRNLLKEVNIT